ncbi:MAG TPA: DUF3078 domain-containing protein, partial [Prolixibacteraceae bacterium]|nr:DUF3078 domain-containing protein [Prolixibacteraceae bacterium]
IRDSLSWSVSFMKKIFNGSGEWFMTDESLKKSIKGVIDYSENEPIDTVVVNLNKLLKSDSIAPIFDREADNIPNKEIVKGYISAEDMELLVESRRNVVADSLRKTLIIVPDEFLDEGLSRAPVIPNGDPLQMLKDMDRTMPVSFLNKYYRGWGNIKLPANVTGAEMDTLRVKLLSWTLQSYNDSILFYQRDSLIQSYRKEFIDKYSSESAAQKRNYLEAKNRMLLSKYNESEIVKVNDSIMIALRYLTNRAAADSSLVVLTNNSGTRAKVWTANHGMSPMRIFLKNEQNDSIGVAVYNNGKGGLRLVIDDGVKFLRLTESQKKEITFQEKKPDSKLQQVYNRQVEPLPWKLLGTGTVGFTQTALSNWAKGGESSISMLLIGKYVANYSKKSLKWENMAEFRLGIFTSKSRGLEKNDDKLEFQSRMGYSAFKKWYYSAEGNFRTQMAKGYSYPDKGNPISAFMAPAYLTASVGMDYKPNKNFSLFLSPFTSKTTYVKDTAMIDPTHFGLEPGKTKLWEPGIIVKMNWHYDIVENITYDTRAEIFNNYNYPFQKFNVNWEQVLLMQITQRINARLMTQVVYDYNVKFPVKDENGVEVDQKAKWQLKELFTLGFNYKF